MLFWFVGVVSPSASKAEIKNTNWWWQR